jgi:hypothetical protein
VRFLPGEVRFANVVHIGEAGTGEAKAREDLTLATDLASAGDCAQAERAWLESRLHVPKNGTWYTQNRPAIASAIATCWVQSSEDSADAEAASAVLAKARFWDYRNEALLRAAKEIGGQLYDEGMVARGEARWDDAYRLFSAAVVARPELSWARRYAEEARDYKLKIDPETLEKKRLEDERKKAEAADRDAEAGRPESQGGEGATPAVRPPPKPAAPKAEQQQAEQAP